MKKAGYAIMFALSYGGPCLAASDAKLSESYLFSDVFNNTMPEAFRTPPDTAKLHQSFLAQKSLKNEAMTSQLVRDLAQVKIDKPYHKRIECGPDICEICYIIPKISIPDHSKPGVNKFTATVSDKIRGVALVTDRKVSILHAGSDDGKTIGVLAHLFK